MGDGVSCISQPTRKTFPVLVGGHWWSTSNSGVYANFNYSSNADVTSDKEYTLTVLSGTWSIATEKSVKSTSAIATSAPNATRVWDGDAKMRPTKASAPSVKPTELGAALTFKEVEYAPQYVIYRDGEVAGYTTTTSFVDTAYTFGESVAYSVAAYVNGACIGDVSNATSFSYVADVTGDGTIDVADAVTLLKNILNGTGGKSIIDVLIVLKIAIKA